jgi:hypothetical protein
METCVVRDTIVTLQQRRSRNFFTYSAVLSVGNYDSILQTLHFQIDNPLLLFVADLFEVVDGPLLGINKSLKCTEFCL